jgi:hypothetical protein
MSCGPFRWMREGNCGVELRCRPGWMDLDLNDFLVPVLMKLGWLLGLVGTRQISIAWGRWIVEICKVLCLRLVGDGDNEWWIVGEKRELMHDIGWLTSILVLMYTSLSWLTYYDSAVFFLFQDRFLCRGESASQVESKAHLLWSYLCVWADVLDFHFHNTCWKWWKDKFRRHRNIHDAA